MEQVWAAIATGICLIIVQIIITWRTNNTQEVKTAAKIDAIVQESKSSCEAIMYRICELEKKQDKHNSLIERMVKVEQKIKDMK